MGRAFFRICSTGTAAAVSGKAASVLLAQFMDFRKKEVINVKNGMKIGYVDDVLFDTEQASIRYIVVYGRPKFFGLFGREEDMQIPWEDIEIVGEDTILVKNDGSYVHRKPARLSRLEQWFG